MKKFSFHPKISCFTFCDSLVHTRSTRWCLQSKTAYFWKYSYTCISMPTWRRWGRIRITGVNSGRILRFSFGPGPGVKNMRKTGPGVNFNSSRSLCGHFLSKNQSKTRIQKFWFGVGVWKSDSGKSDRFGVGVWKSDSGHLCYLAVRTCLVHAGLAAASVGAVAFLFMF